MWLLGNGGKLITVNVDQVQIYHPRERGEGVVETDGLNGERSRAELVETEGSKGVASEESSKEGQWRGRRVRSKGSTESCNDREGRIQNERGLPVKMNGRKRPGIRKMTSREAADESGVLSRRSSPGPPRGVSDNERQVLPERSSPYQLRSRRHNKEGQEESRR
ncbi:hypothetical protein NPIL_342331 [Nephila pilipes]|uniref:Uncharacterized protein n=1 Tax=Nephila pilipes TaxID=299642 RepID=A0A8X6TE73_NEPPI|nr:hypothetical protein NPIL_59211 [Nephila pilipes]GFT31000.1 hypothetical protein NPIL_407251 [Nephila pilipes]GFT31253.1 hypothetical protein NPIL_559531 [Nephila pilipes]GFT62455.1 hypothetical protein NPIL_652561 [Nephila pilipes]GFT83070.1 hypothetical protein NPIL_124371 [Nephila pilipes]